MNWLLKLLRRRSKYLSPEFRFKEEADRSLQKIARRHGLELFEGGAKGVEDGGFSFRWVTAPRKAPCAKP
jgi:hypothetical protein